MLIIVTAHKALGLLEDFKKYFSRDCVYARGIIRG
jgi:hypothetical protein